MQTLPWLLRNEPIQDSHDRQWLRRQVILALRCCAADGSPKLCARLSKQLSRINQRYTDLVPIDTTEPLDGKTVAHLLEKLQAESPENPPVPEVRSRDRMERQGPRIPLIPVLDRLRSAHNVGTIVRTAECAGVTNIGLCAWTPTFEHKSVAKASLGAEKNLKAENFASAEEAIATYRERGVFVAALELTSNAKTIWSQETFPKPMALILGNERFGLEADLCAKVDCVLSIPMSGKKNSLNVSSAFAVAAFHIQQVWSRSDS